jgi:putative ABC transport system ATP-binding protein
VIDIFREVVRSARRSNGTQSTVKADVSAAAPVVLNPAPLIQLENLHKTYTTADVPVRAVRGITLRILRGEFVAIMGASGSGKSTLMNVLGCLDRPTEGRYLLDGADVGTLDRDELADLRNLKLGFIFQGFNLLSRTTALENVELPMLCGAKRRWKTQEARERALERLRTVGLAERADHFPNQLSGGQQQRVAIARALVNEPEIILADEPTGNLDSQTSLEIVGLLQGLNDAGMTIVMVTHDLYLARFCKRMLVMRDGLLVDDRRIVERLRAADELKIVREEQLEAQLISDVESEDRTSRLA